MKNYQEWYGHVASNIKNKPFLLSLLRTFNRFYDSSHAYSLFNLVNNYLSPTRTWEAGLDVCVCPASGFVILSFLRKKINAPRPYEEWDIKPLLDREIVLVSQCPVVMSFSNHYLHGLLTC